MPSYRRRQNRLTRLKLASLECFCSWCGEALFDQVITISNVFITREAEEVIRDATARCGELDLIGVGTHRHHQIPYLTYNQNTLGYEELAPGIRIHLRYCHWCPFGSDASVIERYFISSHRPWARLSQRLRWIS